MKKKINNKSKQGFTLIEFSLALAVLSIFLIMVLQIFNSSIAIYQKGLSMKAISTAGRDVTDELLKTISESPSIDLTSLCADKFAANDGLKNKCQSDHAQQLAYRSFDKNRRGIDLSSHADKTEPYYGVFCTGRYSYFWNTGYAIRNNQKKTVSYDGPDLQDDMRLVRFEDSDRSLCANIAYQDGAVNFSVNTVQTSAPIEILSNSEDLKVALYDFTIFPVSQYQASSSVFYSGTFVLGTLLENSKKQDGGIEIDRKSNQDYCGGNAINSVGSDFTYCAINKFNFAAQAS